MENYILALKNWAERNPENCTNPVDFLDTSKIQLQTSEMCPKHW